MQYPHASTLALTRLLTSTLLALAVLIASSPNARAVTHKRLLSYYPEWAKGQTPPYSAAQIPYTKMTHIAHAFLLLDPAGSGKLTIPSGFVEPLLISRAHAAGVKVMVSIGGGDPVQGNAFAKMAAHPAYRALFIKNVFNFVKANGYDGVDIDWEVPVAPHDTQNCVMLMQAMRVQFPAPKYLLSMAIPSDPRSYGSGFDVPSLAPNLDFINVMTYDFHGPWSDHAGHNSPLFLNPADPGQEGSLADSMDLFANTYGVPAAKLNVGTAFYGYEFDGAQDLWNYCTNCATTTSSWNYGTYIKQRINAQGWVAFRDNVAKAPYLLYQGRSGGLGFLTYDDATSTFTKGNYVLGTRNFGGVFMWSLDADYDGKSQDLLDALHRAFIKY